MAMEVSTESRAAIGWTVYGADSRFSVNDMHCGFQQKPPASQVCTQPLFQAQIKENIEALRHWPLWGEFTGDRWIPRTKGQ